MSLLARAVRARKWELVALCLLLGTVQALSQLPADSAATLLNTVEGKDGKR